MYCFILHMYSNIVQCQKKTWKMFLRYLYLFRSLLRKPTKLRTLTTVLPGKKIAKPDFIILWLTLYCIILRVNINCFNHIFVNKETLYCSFFLLRYKAKLFLKIPISCAIASDCIAISHSIFIGVSYFKVVILVFTLQW